MRAEARRRLAWLLPPAAGLLLIATALVSHTLCSETFLSGLDPDQVYSETFRAFPGIRWIDWALRYKVDRARREVSATLLGGFASRAVYREGAGCRLVHGGEAESTPSTGRTIATSPPAAPWL